jgi:chemotaxis protein methyltransferase CheR
VSRAAEWTECEPDLRLGAGDFEQIRQLAHRTFGLDLKPGKEELVSARLRRLVRSGGFPSFQEYYRHVLRDASGQALEAMIDALATNHTGFLREPAHFDFLREKVLPEFSGPRSFEIWCAACSTGEEVWTLAFLISDALPSQNLRITATDISTKALRFAQEAVYSAERCQGLPPAWKSRYMVFSSGAREAFRVTPRICERASFRRINLIETIPWNTRFPVIFCRNVMIYFDRPTQEHVVRQLAERLEPGGYLFVGHAESLTRISHSLDYVQPAVYRKPGYRGAKWTRS